MKVETLDFEGKKQKFYCTLPWIMLEDEMSFDESCYVRCQLVFGLGGVKSCKSIISYESLQKLGMGAEIDKTVFKKYMARF